MLTVTSLDAGLAGPRAPPQRHRTAQARKGPRVSTTLLTGIRVQRLASSPHQPDAVLRSAVVHRRVKVLVARADPQHREPA